MKAEIAINAATGDRPEMVRAGDRWHVLGQACLTCGQTYSIKSYRCGVCSSELGAAMFGPAGTVWSFTTVTVPVPNRESPYTIAYVDLDDGPRILASVPAASALSIAVGDRAQLVGITDLGNPLITLTEGAS